MRYAHEKLFDIFDAKQYFFVSNITQFGFIVDRDQKDFLIYKSYISNESCTPDFPLFFEAMLIRIL